MKWLSLLLLLVPPALILFALVTDPRRRLIRFRRLARAPVWVGDTRVEIWEIAFGEDHLNAKLGGDVAEVRMHARPWYLRKWWLRTRNDESVRTPQGWTLCAEFYVPFWAWPLEVANNLSSEMRRWSRPEG